MYDAATAVGAKERLHKFTQGVSRVGFEPTTHGLKVSCVPSTVVHGGTPSLCPGPLASTVIHQDLLYFTGGAAT